MRTTRKFTPKVPKVSLQTWVTMEEYAAVERVCLAKHLSLSQIVREGAALAAKKYAEEIAA